MSRAIGIWHVLWLFCFLCSNHWTDLYRTDFIRPGPTTAILCGRLQYALCHVARAYGTWHVIWQSYLLQPNGWTDLDRTDDFHIVKRWDYFLYIWMLTKPDIQLEEIASRAITGRPIETGKTTFDSSLRETDDKIGSGSLCVKWHLHKYIGRGFKCRLIQSFLMETPMKYTILTQGTAWSNAGL